MFYDKYLLLCQQKGVSPSKAAEDAGFAKSLVTKWKANKIDIPSADVLSKLSAYFCVPISELLNEEKEQPTTNGGLFLDGITDMQRFIIEEVLKMPEDRQLALAKLLGLSE